MRIQALLFFGCLVLCSCKDEAPPPPEEPSKILGEWVIDRATRNGLATETLRGMFIRFDEQRVSTNMLSEEMSGSYQLDGSTIEHDLNGLDSDLSIRVLTDSTLELTTTMRGYAFEFFLIRADGESESAPVPADGEEI